MTGFVHIRVFNDFDLCPTIQPLMSYFYGEVLMSTIVSYYIQNLYFHQYALRRWGIFVVITVSSARDFDKVRGGLSFRVYGIYMTLYYEYECLGKVVYGSMC